MGKRKAEVFTVLESVGNWFEARPYSPAPLDGSAELTNRPKIIDEALVQPDDLSEATKGPGLAGHPTGADEEEPVSDVAYSGGTTVEAGAETLSQAEEDNSQRALHEAFWSMLQSAGYEIW